MVSDYMIIDVPMHDKFEELKKVLNGIKKGEKILIIGDSDGDGIPGAAIFAKILKKLGLEYKKDFQVVFVEHDFRNFIKENKEQQEYFKTFNYLFLIDMSMDDYSFLTNNYICVIDHHKAEGKVNLMINPMYDSEMKNKINLITPINIIYYLLIQLKNIAIIKIL